MLKKVLTIFCFSLFMVGEAFGFDIVLDPSNYIGRYAVLGETGFLTGIQTISLDEGAYTMRIGNVGQFGFSVDSVGDVTVNNGVSAVGGNLSMTFSNNQIDVNVGAYTGDWNIGDATPLAFTTGSLSNINLVPGVEYRVNVGGLGNFRIFLNNSSLVTVNNGISGVGAVGSLTFNTVIIDVDVADYAGEWLISRAEPSNFTSGSIQGVNLVPGVDYRVNVGGIGNFSITIAADGSITVQNGISATTQIGSMTFNTEGVNVDPGVNTEQWAIVRAEPGSFVSGPLQNIRLVSGVSYRLNLQNGERMDFDVSSPCQVTPGTLPFTGGDFSISCFIPQSFTCENKTDYNPALSCAGRFVANNQSELDMYLMDFGAGSGNYQNLTIRFDLTGGDVTIHSPCKIKVQSESNIQTANLCLDGREGVNIRSESTISSGEVVILSEIGNAEINSDANVTADSLKLEGALRTRIRSNAVVNVAGDLSLTSTGSDVSKSRAVIRPFSQVTAANIFMNSSVISVIRHDSTVNTGLLSILGTGEVRIGNRVDIDSSEIIMNGQDRFSIGRNATVDVTGNFDGSGNPCDVKATAQITTGSQSGTCSPF